MPSFPSFDDLGKSARDLFFKKFDYGETKLKWKTTALSESTEFKCGGSHKHVSNCILGNFETKHKCRDSGLTYSLKWNTNNMAEVGVKYEDKPIEGVTTEAELQFIPLTGWKSGKVKTAYKNGFMHANVDVDMFDSHACAATVLRCWNLVGGLQVGFDSHRKAMSDVSAAFGYLKEDIIFHVKLEKSQFEFSMYQKANEHVELGVLHTWPVKGDILGSTFALAAKYMPSQESSVKVKVNNQSQLALSLQHQIAKGINVIGSMLYDGRQSHHACHKIGIAIELES